jgi:hypothetical protein
MLRVMTGAFLVFFAFACVFIAAVFCFIVYAIVRNRNALKAAGYDPVTAQVQMADRVVKGFEGKPLEQRLAELDDLHRRGLISAEEHAAGRTAALTQG